MSVIGVTTVVIISVLLLYGIVHLYIRETEIEKFQENGCFLDESVAADRKFWDNDFLFKVLRTEERSATAREKMKKLSDGGDPEALFYLVRDDECPEMPVKVIHKEGIFVGYMDSEVVAEVAPLLEHGEVFVCRLHWTDGSELWLKARRITSIGNDSRREFMERVVGAYEASMNLEEIDKAAEKKKIAEKERNYS